MYPVYHRTSHTPKNVSKIYIPNSCESWSLLYSELRNQRWGGVRPFSSCDVRPKLKWRAIFFPRRGTSFRPRLCAEIGVPHHNKQRGEPVMDRSQSHAANEPSLEALTRSPLLLLLRKALRDAKKLTQNRENTTPPGEPERKSPREDTGKK